MGTYDKAIPSSIDLVRQQPGWWQDGALLLVQAYTGAGRTEDAIAWLDQQAAEDSDLLPTLADLYECTRRWKGSGRYLCSRPRNHSQ